MIRFWSMMPLLLSLSIAGPVRAQRRDTTSQAHDTLSAHRAMLALARLRPGQRVHIVTKDSQYVDGHIVEASSSLIAVRYDDSVSTVPSDRIDSLVVRSGAHAGMGALIGGLLLGAVAASMGSSSSCNEGPCFSPEGGFFVGFVVGLLPGALIGAAIPHWEQRVP